MMYDRRAIMRQAWRLVRDEFTVAGRFLRPSAEDWGKVLAWALREAWRLARIAQRTEQDRQREIDWLEARLDGLKYRPIGHNTGREAQSLQRRIDELRLAA